MVSLLRDSQLSFATQQFQIWPQLSTITNNPIATHNNQTHVHNNYKPTFCNLQQLYFENVQQLQQNCRFLQQLIPTIATIRPWDACLIGHQCQTFSLDMNEWSSHSAGIFNDLLVRQQLLTYYFVEFRQETKYISQL